MPVAAAMLGSSLIGAGASIWGANKAADAQTDAANAQIQAQHDALVDLKGQLNPFKNLGLDAIDRFGKNWNYLTKPFSMDQAALEKTPGYQFTLAQGLKGVANSAAARGLGTSGAALKGAAGYATGLADSTYLDQYNVERQNRNDLFNRLMGMTTLGENAAAGVGAGIQNTANATSNALMSAGNAQAAAANTIGQSIGSAANSIPMALMYNQLMAKSQGNAAGNGGMYGTWWGG